MADLQGFQVLQSCWEISKPILAHLCKSFPPAVAIDISNSTDLKGANKLNSNNNQRKMK